MFALSNIFNSISWRFYPCHIFEAPLLMCAFHSQGLEPITGMSFYMYTKWKPWLQIFNSTCWTSLPAPFASWSLGKSSHKTLALCLLCKYESYKCVCITLLFTLASGFFGVRLPENFHTLGNVCMVCTSAVSRQKAQQNWVPRTHFLLELFSSRSIFFNQAFLRVRYSLHSWRFWRKIVLREDTFIQSYPKQSLSMEVPTMKDKMR